MDGRKKDTFEKRDMYETKVDELEFVELEAAAIRYGRASTQPSLKEGSKRYKALLDEALELHVRKNQGYAADNPDAFANFRLAEGMGLTPVQGVLVRMGDKFARVQSLAKNPENDRVGESMRDTLMDLSAYALIAICLMEEQKDMLDPYGDYTVPLNPHPSLPLVKAHIEEATAVWTHSDDDDDREMC